MHGKSFAEGDEKSLRRSDLTFYPTTSCIFRICPDVFPGYTFDNILLLSAYLFTNNLLQMVLRLIGQIFDSKPFDADRYRSSRQDQKAL